MVGCAKMNLAKFTDEEVEIMDFLKGKHVNELDLKQSNFIQEKYASIFGELDPYLNKPLYQEISDILIAPALKRGVHTLGLHPLITQEIALRFTMGFPDELSNLEYEKRKKILDTSNLVLIRVYNQIT